MNTSYNRIAGQSVERLAALSDGIFAVAMTLLVLDLHVPARELIHSDGDLRRALVAMAPQLLVYLMSFVTLGIFWVGQQTQLNHLERSDRDLTWTYWSNILLFGVLLYLSWGRAVKAQLVKGDIPAEVPAAICRRILIGQALYAFGALLCMFNTYWSIAFIVLVQLNYAIAPRIGKRRE